MKEKITKNKLLFTIIIIPSVAICSFTLLAGLFFGKDIVINKIRLNNFHNQHKELETMSASELIYEYKDIGILEGNSNHCDLGSVLVYKANLDFKDFSEFYKDKKINGFNDESKEFDESLSINTLELEYGKTDSLGFDYEFIRWHLLSDKEFQKVLQKEGKVYLTWVRDYNLPNNDPSCH